MSCEWFGLGSEINTLAEGGDPLPYAELVDVVNTLAPELRARGGSRIFVSFQVDQANGAVGQDTIDHFALIDDFDIDALGLSSYPGFFWPTPEDFPSDYLDRFDEATDLPLIFVEGGWASRDIPGKTSTEQQQRDWFEGTSSQLDRIGAEVWVMLTFTDLDIPSLGLPPERAATLSNFASMESSERTSQESPRSRSGNRSSSGRISRDEKLGQPDGSLLVSDDGAWRVYRITYEP